MKYIKKRNKEPQELVEYRKTSGVTYAGLGKDIKDIIRKSLVEEQGYICAYCMGKIYVANCTIEHYISQTRHENSTYTEKVHRINSLKYANMCGVCINDSEHCDKKRGNIPLEILDPHNPSCEELIAYNLNGEIIPNGIEEDKVLKDIQTLGLDCQTLIEARNATWEDVWERFKQDNDKKTWTKDLFLEYAQKYRNKKVGKFGLRYHSYCNFIAWYFEYYANNYKNF